MVACESREGLLLGTQVTRLTELVVPYNPQVDYRETYWILKRKLTASEIRIAETAIFWNEEDNVASLDILNDMFTPNTIDLCAAAAKGSVKIVAWLLADGQAHPGAMSTEGTYALHLAAENGHAEVVKLLLADSRVDPDQYHYGHTPLCLACKAKHKERLSSYVKIVAMLLANERVDPTYGEATALYLAASCSDDNSQIVDLLLVDGRVDPRRHRTHLINTIARQNVNIVRRLLQDYRVNPNIREGDPLKLACMYGHTEMIKLLLSDPRVDPTLNNNCALRTVLSGGQDEETRLLLANKRVLDNIKPELAQLVRDLYLEEQVATQLTKLIVYFSRDS
ncbi:Ankyrin repeat protein [uncultured virus]|nr:Ankyrin repeat protein [uncultured virus]